MGPFCLRALIPAPTAHTIRRSEIWGCAVPQQGDGPRSFRLRPQQRLREPEDFQNVYAGQEALHGPSVVVFFRPNGLPVSRMGVSVGRKHGNAVRRNRIKRVLREAFRLSQSILPAGYDYVLIPRRGVKIFRTTELRAALASLARRVPLPGEGTRAAHARKGQLQEEAAGGGTVKQRRGISSRTFLKKPPPKP